MATTHLAGAEQLHAAVGRHLGYSDWLTLNQQRIDEFAAATGDHQWIHVDAERAAAGPFGTTIAHGYLTLSLSNFFLPQIVEVTGFAMGVNYGTNKVRFVAPVPVGSRIRAGAQLTDVAEVAGGLQTTMVVTIDIEGAGRPACVIESISRWLFS